MTGESLNSGRVKAMTCPRCQALLRRIETPYGERATCELDSVRFTRLHGEQGWTPEPFIAAQNFSDTHPGRL